MIKDALNSAIDSLKKIRLDHDPIIHFPTGIWALDKNGNILQDINDYELNNLHVLIIKDEAVYNEFHATYWQHMQYPSFDTLHGFCLYPNVKSGIYQAVYNEQLDVYEFISITDSIKSLKSAKLI